MDAPRTFLCAVLQNAFQRYCFLARRHSRVGRRGPNVLFSARDGRFDRSMTHHDEEFAARRAPIRERGTVRMVLLPLTLGVWAGAAVATMVAIQLPIAALLPLLSRAAGVRSY